MCRVREHPTLSFLLPVVLSTAHFACPIASGHLQSQILQLLPVAYAIQHVIRDYSGALRTG